MVALFHQKMKNNNNNNKKKFRLVGTVQRTYSPHTATHTHTHTRIIKTLKVRSCPKRIRESTSFSLQKKDSQRGKKIKQQQQQQLARPGIGKNDGTSINRNEREPPPVYHLLFYYSLPF
jgi:hypothetical protein